MIDLVITHLTHSLGPPWTLETLGDHWRPLATLGDMLENDHFGHFQAFSGMSPIAAKGLQGFGTGYWELWQLAFMSWLKVANTSWLHFIFDAQGRSTLITVFALSLLQFLLLVDFCNNKKSKWRISAMNTEDGLWSLHHSVGGKALSCCTALSLGTVAVHCLPRRLTKNSLLCLTF